MATRIWTRFVSGSTWDQDTTPNPFNPIVPYLRDFQAPASDTTVVRQILDMTMTWTWPETVPSSVRPEWPYAASMGVGVGVSAANDFTPLILSQGQDHRVTGTAMFSLHSWSSDPNTGRASALFKMPAEIDVEAQRKSPDPTQHPVGVIQIGWGHGIFPNGTAPTWTVDFAFDWRVLYQAP